MYCYSYEIIDEGLIRNFSNSEWSINKWSIEWVMCVVDSLINIVDYNVGYELFFTNEKISPDILEEFKKKGFILKPFNSTDYIYLKFRDYVNELIQESRSLNDPITVDILHNTLTCFENRHNKHKQKEKLAGKSNPVVYPFINME